MTESTWNGFRRIDFLFEGREAILVFPKEENKRPYWLFKTEYFSAFQDMEAKMVGEGWHLAFIQNKTRWCLDEDLDLKKRFADYLAKEYGLYEKCVPVGMSCGGLIGTKFAAKYPEKVSCLYLDAPVLNLLSIPAGLGVGEGNLFEEFHTATGMTMSELICYREHPIDKLSILTDNHIPVILVYGEADTLVPYVENGAILEKHYKENRGILQVISKPGCGHHPHGLEHPEPVMAFIEEHKE
ncbi:MAG: alpha/beta hydrolase [Clostridia bacterium]|nr:alpha/beta hydrolase [Clostridia bacterium]